MHEREKTPERHLCESAARQERCDFSGALRDARRAIDAAGACGSPPDLLAKAFLRAARNAYYLSRFDESSAYLDRFAALPPGPDATRAILQLEAALVRANILRRLGSYREALVLLDRFDDPGAGPLPVELAGERLLIEGSCRYYLNETQRAREIIETAMGLCHGDSRWRLRSRVLVISGLVMQRLGFLRKAADDLKRAAALCDGHGDIYGASAARLNLGIVLYHEGRLDAAREAVEQAERGFRRIRWSIGSCRCRIASGNIAVRLGDPEGAAGRYSEAARMARRSGFRREEALAMSGLGAAHVDRGEFRKAKACFTLAQVIAEEIAPEGDLAGEISLGRATLATRSGDTAGAIPFLDEAELIFTRLGAVLGQGLVARGRGIVAFMAGDGAEGRRWFARSRDLVAESGCIFELAESCLLHAESVMGRVPGGTAPRSLDERETREVSRLLIEARYLSSVMGVGHFVERVERHIAGVDLRFGDSLVPGEAQDGRNPVEVRFSPGYQVSEGFVSVSPLMYSVWKRIQLAASFEGAVCITGETGTGKELVARLIHKSGGRASGPFVAVNCAAIPDHLFESEFFGHRKGCFTGALADRRGFFEEADGGTLFLDEVGELSAMQQAKLLRVLQEGTLRRIGENAERRIDIKVISATNRDLERSLEDASLRSDFYFRVSAERIHVPPLRERREDIIPLIAWRFGSVNGGAPLRIEHDALLRLQRYPWPGNVRELFAVADRIRRSCEGGVVCLRHLPAHLCGEKRCGVPGSAENRETGKERLERAMNVCLGNKSAAARWLGISRGTLYKELRRTGLDRYYSNGNRLTSA